jgi:DNA-binding SARP family transcriptional activator
MVSGVGLAAQGRAGAADTIERAARAFAELGAGVLEANALGYAALAALKAGQRDSAGRLGAQARSLAALLDVPGASGVASLVMGNLTQDEQELQRAQDLLEPRGTWAWHLAMATGQRPVPSVGAAVAPAVEVATNGHHPDASPSGGVSLRCLGGFSLTIDGHVVDDGAAKPMERSLLHLLAIRANEAVHREALIEALWPDAEPEAGRHRLQVAVSSLRRLLTSTDPDAARLLSRDGDAYRLSLPPGSEYDIEAFEAAVEAATKARARDDLPAERDALRQALALYGGPVLPGDGPVDWAQPTRTRLQGEVTDAAARLGALLLQDAQPQAAVEVARSGLAIDRYRDDLWKVLIEASERAGNYADAGQARRAYEAVLDELGV